MWSEGRRMGSDFASGSFVAADGKTAQFPDAWKAAWNWYYNGIWTDHFIANTTEENSTLLASGNPPSSGHVAMAEMFQWYDCCMTASTPSKTIQKWDVAIQPTYNGAMSAPLDMDVFSIAKASKDPQDAFTALTYIAARGDLSATYGGIPLVGSQLDFYHQYIDGLLKPEFPQIYAKAVASIGRLPSIWRNTLRQSTTKPLCRTTSSRWTTTARSGRPSDRRRVSIWTRSPSRSSQPCRPTSTRLHSEVSTSIRS